MNLSPYGLESLSLREGEDVNVLRRQHEKSLADLPLLAEKASPTSAQSAPAVLTSWPAPATVRETLR